MCSHVRVLFVCTHLETSGGAQRADARMCTWTYAATHLEAADGALRAEGQVEPLLVLVLLRPPEKDGCRRHHEVAGGEGHGRFARVPVWVKWMIQCAVLEPSQYSMTHPVGYAFNQLCAVLAFEVHGHVVDDVPHAIGLVEIHLHLLRLRGANDDMICYVDMI